MRRVCYYHAGCPDGFGAAWAVWRAWGDEARYVPRSHDPEQRCDVHSGEVVAFADIAPDNDHLRELAEHAAQVLVLDHHLSAYDRYLSDPSVENAVREGGHTVHFDLQHSGAVLAWQAFHPGQPTPPLLEYVEDQDLWNWKLPRSAEVNSAIGSHRRDFETWSRLALRSPEDLAKEGEPILRAQRSEVERLLHQVHPVTVADHRVEAVNSQHHRSHIGHALAKREAYGHPIGLVYRIQGRQVDASIYSIGDVDVSVLAGHYGGGGHRNASGFSVPLDRWLKDFC